MILVLNSILFAHGYVRPHSSSHEDISSLTLHLESITKILGKSLEKIASKNVILLIKNSNKHYYIFKGTQIYLYIFFKNAIASKTQIES